MTITFENVQELTEALKKAQEAHHQYEIETGEPHKDWAPWYAEWIAQNRLSLLAQKMKEDSRVWWIQETAKIAALQQNSQGWAEHNKLTRR